MLTCLFFSRQRRRVFRPDFVRVTAHVNPLAIEIGPNLKLAGVREKTRVEHHVVCSPYAQFWLKRVNHPDQGTLRVTGVLRNSAWPSCNVDAAARAPHEPRPPRSQVAATAAVLAGHNLRSRQPGFLAEHGAACVGGPPTTSAIAWV